MFPSACYASKSTTILSPHAAPSGSLRLFRIAAGCGFTLNTCSRRIKEPISISSWAAAARTWPAIRIERNRFAAKMNRSSRMSHRFRRLLRVGAISLCLLTSAVGSYSQTMVTNDLPLYGPFNAVFFPDGDGLKKPLRKDDSVLRAASPWALYGWGKSAEPLKGPSLVAGIGDPAEEFSRYLAFDGEHVTLWMGKDNSLSGAASLATGKWHFLAATFDGEEFRLYSDGLQIASGKLDLGSVSPVLQMAPAFLPASNWSHFGGTVAGLNVARRALSADEVKQLSQAPEDFSLIEYEEGSKPWPVQTRGQAGYRAPQDPATMPRSNAPFSRPVAKKPPAEHEVLEANGEGEWTLAGGWRMTPAPKVNADGAAISVPAYSARDWWPATVPGTVLTTMIDRGVYADPDYGLNNLAIPETLNQQDYWYRVEFRAPKTMDGDGKRLTLTFQGINYEAAVWLNGRQLGSIKGAFIRGAFDVTGVVKAEQVNVIAVRVSPPPHPGIPQEQSIKGGPGENGGLMCLDGPTFVATEGWDWIPAIRDRDTGIWQPVTLRATEAVKIGDPQVVTSLPLPDTSSAKVEMVVPLTNAGDTLVHGTLKAEFEGVTATKNVDLKPGDSEVKLTPADFPQLTVTHPRLWWPNGYGKQELYHLKLSFAVGGPVSDTKEVRFGIREITYELSLLDTAGHLRRVKCSPEEADK